MQRQQPRKEEAGLVPESLFLSPIAAWLAGATASPARPRRPAPPLSGEFNSLPAGSLTLLCSEARNYKIYRKKNDLALQLHTGASPAAPQSRPLPPRTRRRLQARPAPQGRSGWQNQGSAPAAELHNAGGSPRTYVGMQSPPLSAFVTPGPRDSTSGAVAKPPQGCSVQPLLGARRRESSRKRASPWERMGFHLPALRTAEKTI